MAASGATGPPTTIGSCLCGKVTYALTGAPIDSKLCHCDNCRKASGSAFAANSFYWAKDFRVTSGSDQLRTYIDKATDAPGGICERSFCGECGSPLFTRSRRFPENVVVTSGTMDLRKGVGEGEGGGIKGEGNGGGIQEWRPQLELYVKRRMGWVRVEGGTDERHEL